MGVSEGKIKKGEQNMNFEKLAFFVLTVLSFACLITFVYIGFFPTSFGPDLRNNLLNFLIAVHILPQGVLAIWMIRDCIRRPFPKTTTRINWLTAIVFFDVFGTTAYYFNVKRGT